MEHTKSQLRIKIIIDSNVLISLEDHGVIDTEQSRLAARFMSLATSNEATIVLAHASRTDFLRSPEPRRSQRLAELAKYTMLAKPFVPESLRIDAGYTPNISPNSQCDLEILAALASGAADWLITDDNSLRNHAEKAGYGERVFSVVEATEILGSLLSIPSTIPVTSTVKGYEINIDASIFSSLKQDYEGFTDWWKTKVCREGRDILILGVPASPEGLSVLKIEEPAEHGINARCLKLCTFKVSEDFGGARRGEQLLKASVDYARINRCTSLYLETFPSNTALVDWLEGFGFSDLQGASTQRGEIVLVKQLAPDPDVYGQTPPLQYNVRFGPGAIIVDDPVLVPVQSHWSKRLFPEESTQLPLFPIVDPCGNAIRKAYLSHSSARFLRPGQTALFYESQGRASVVAIGVIESALISRDPDEILKTVGNRTVYSRQEIEALCGSEVLTILFRFDRLVSPVWTLDTLKKEGVLHSHPQSIQRVGKDGIDWVRKQLEG